MVKLFGRFVFLGIFDLVGFRVKFWLIWFGDCKLCCGDNIFDVESVLGDELSILNLKLKFVREVIC